MVNYILHVKKKLIVGPLGFATERRQLKVAVCLHKSFLYETSEPETNTQDLKYEAAERNSFLILHFWSLYVTPIQVSSEGGLVI